MNDDSILLVDDDPGSIKMMALLLADVGQLRFATSGDEAIQLARRAAPDLILLDAEMPGMSGFQVCATLKRDPLLADVPVIFVTSHAGSEFEQSAFAIGAVDFIAKPVSPPILLARVRTHLRIQRLLEDLRCASSIDALTSVANRRSFDETLRIEWRRARRSGESLSLLMIDVDHFKLFNDRYGHPAGDACLRKLAGVLSAACLRPGDLVARYGGEEFVILLPRTDLDGAGLVAERVVAELKALAIPHLASPTAPVVTVSVGVGCCADLPADSMFGLIDSQFAGDMQGDARAADLVAAADTALYAAKHSGRGCIRSQRVGVAATGAGPR